jgi:hypothetical protein
MPNNVVISIIIRRLDMPCFRCGQDYQLKKGKAKCKGFPVSLCQGCLSECKGCKNKKDEFCLTKSDYGDKKKSKKPKPRQVIKLKPLPKATEEKVDEDRNIVYEGLPYIKPKKKSINVKKKSTLWVGQKYAAILNGSKKPCYFGTSGMQPCVALVLFQEGTKFCLVAHFDSDALKKGDYDYTVVVATLLIKFISKCKGGDFKAWIVIGSDPTFANNSGFKLASKIYGRVKEWVQDYKTARRKRLDEYNEVPVYLSNSGSGHIIVNIDDKTKKYLYSVRLGDLQHYQKDVFDIDDGEAKNKKYFEALHNETKFGNVVIYRLNRFLTKNPKIWEPA